MFAQLLGHHQVQYRPIRIQGTLLIRLGYQPPHRQLALRSLTLLCLHSVIDPISRPQDQEHHLL